MSLFLNWLVHLYQDYSLMNLLRFFRDIQHYCSVYLFLQIICRMFDILFWTKFGVSIYWLPPVFHGLIFPQDVKSYLDSFAALSAAKFQAIQPNFVQVYSKLNITVSCNFSADSYLIYAVFWFCSQTVSLWWF